MTMNLIQSIDALLPQTQCGKCGHPGCLPYAQGIAQGEAINKCPPGGDETIAALAQLLTRPPAPLDIERGTAPAQVAFIREAECIGCTKCIQACPVDAIVGAAKLMHTVIVDECTGCDLCVAPCPVDCIDMVPLAPNVVPVVSGLASTRADYLARSHKRNHARSRFELRNARLLREEQRRQAERALRAQKASAPATSPGASMLAEGNNLPASTVNEEALKKARIELAMTRAQLHKSLKAFGHPPIAEQAARLVHLQAEYEAAERALAGLQDKDTPLTLPPRPKMDSSVIKRAKVQLAMARAALQKAQASDARPEEIERLCDHVQRAEHVLAEAEPGVATANTKTTAQKENPGR
jgi:electron transport complex protein RnfB